MSQLFFYFISTLLIFVTSTAAVGGGHLDSEESVFERFGECGQPPLPDCNSVIIDAIEQRQLRIALREALDEAVENERSRSRSNEVIVGVMPDAGTVVDSQLEFLSVSDFTVSYSATRFRGSQSECGKGRVWITDGFGQNETLARGWSGRFRFKSTFIGQTRLKVGSFDGCAMIVSFVFE